MNNRFVKQGLTEESRKQQKCLPLRFLSPKWYSWRWRQQQIDANGATPELGEGFDTLEYMVSESAGYETCQHRAMVCACASAMPFDSQKLHYCRISQPAILAITSQAAAP